MSQAPPRTNVPPADPDSGLYYGDCLRVLTREIAPASVDLIYLDPPFNSKRDYNIPLGGKAQASVFQDTWVWSQTQEDSMEFLAREPVLFQQVQLLLKFAGGGHIAGGGGLEAYLAYMAARLFACRLALKETGSIYLHCDPTAGHYLKLLMDAVFGSENFRNEIVWQRSQGFKRKTARQFPQKNDNILFYANLVERVQFNTQYKAHKPEYIRRFKKDERGRLYRDDVNPTVGGRRTIYLDETQGDIIDSVWTDIPPVNPNAQERLGYPTQKPLALLERIVKASSNPGDLVLDPFCGCGTAVEAAQKLGRRWIGIDVEPLAVDLMARRLRERCGISPRISGIPYDFDQAQRLAGNAPYEFERWALRLVPGAQPNFKQSGDGGLDGRAVVNVDRRPQPLYGFQVKGGRNVGRPAADAFSGALTQHGCDAGLLIVLNERNARHIRHALGSQDRVQLNGWKGPRVSVWSVEDWFDSGLQCRVPRPSLMGEAETLELLRPQDWQRRLGI